MDDEEVFREGRRSRYDPRFSGVDGSCEGGTSFPKRGTSFEDVIVHEDPTT